MQKVAETNKKILDLRIPRKDIQHKNNRKLTSSYIDSEIMN